MFEHTHLWNFDKISTLLVFLGPLVYLEPESRHLWWVRTELSQEIARLGSWPSAQKSVKMSRIMYVNHKNLALKTPSMLLEFRYLESLPIIDIHIFCSDSAQKMKCPSSAQLGKFQLELVTRLSTLESGINVPLHLLIFWLFTRGYDLIPDFIELI